MKNDKKIKSIINKIKYECNDYLNYVNNYNECAYSDRKIEDIIINLKKLEQLYKNSFEKIQNDKKDIER